MHQDREEFQSEKWEGKSEGS